jgi:uncharacterized protein YjbI with pentapeptide repeats
MALAAWHGGDERLAMHERFEQALKVTGAEGIWKEFTKQEGGNESNLAVHFYLKRAEKDAKGFEFTHKSFGEYLTARALIRTATITAQLAERRIEYAMTEWLEAVGDGELSEELLDFLRDEARLCTTEMMQRTLRILEKVMSEVVSQGFPAHKLGCETWRKAEERQRKAETMLMALLHCLSKSLSLTNESNAVISINWHGDRLAFGNLLHRIRRNRDRPLPVTSLFSRMDLRHASLLATDMIEINLSKADLSSASLNSASLVNANLRATNFKAARFYGANLRGADLEAANLEGADLEAADLERADLQRANLKKADLKRANLEGADLKGANLEGADLSLRARTLKAQTSEKGSLQAKAYLRGRTLRG